MEKAGISILKFRFFFELVSIHFILKIKIPIKHIGF